MSRRRRLEQGSLFALSLLPLMMAASGAAAQSLPSGGSVVSGSAAIGYTSANDMIIAQTSGKAIINWGDFSIGQGKSVTFENGTGATLNRATGTNVSNLQGALNASGSVYLINPNGVIVGSTGVVNVGGSFIASTLNVTDANFLAGGTLTFQGASTAAVKNLGRVGALGGDVVLIAATVTNEGAIEAGGAAALAAGSKVVMREANANSGPAMAVQLSDSSVYDGRFTVEIGAGDVTNIGAITAAEAELRANGGNVYALAGNTGGTINVGGNFDNDLAITMMSPGGGSGRVYLTAGTGNVVSSGTIIASNSVSMQGAQVAIAGSHVETNGWVIDANDFTIGDAEATALTGAMAYGGFDPETEQSTYGGAYVYITARTGDIVLDTTNVTLNIADRRLELNAFRNVTLNDAISANRTYQYPWGPSSGTGTLALRSDSTGSGVGVVSGVRLNEGNAEVTTNVADYSDYGDMLDSLYDTNPDADSFKLTMLVNSYADLKRIATDTDGDARGNFLLSRDIDASASADGGYVGATLRGDFDGGYHTISNLKVTAQDAGLFAALESARVSALTLAGGSATGTLTAGAVAGRASNSTIDSVKSSMDVSNASLDAAAATGGLIGYASGAQVYGVEVSGKVAGVNKVGGLIGYGSMSNIGSGIFSGEVTGENQVGGLAGKFEGAAYHQINSGIVSGKVTGSGLYTGGLVGNLNGGRIAYSKFSGVVIGGNYTGGIAGNVQNTSNVGYPYWARQLSDNTASGSVTGADYTGGLIGAMGASTSIVNSNSSAVVSGGGNVGGAVGAYFGNAFDNINASGSVTGSGDNVGGLVGISNGVISSGRASGSVIGGGDSVGGLVGFSSGTIYYSNATGDVVSVSGVNVGGLVGYSGGAIYQSSARGDVAGAGGVGGLVGYSNGLIDSSVASGKVTGLELQNPGDGENEGDWNKTAVGGLVGYNYYSNISNSSASGAVNGKGVYFGGLVGYTYGTTIGQSFATGAVDGQHNVGGLVGNGGNLVVQNSYATGAVTGGNYDGLAQPGGATGTGGLIGFLRDSIDISNSYATGKVVGDDNTGGLIGLAGQQSRTNVRSSWASGDVDGGDGYNVGGLIGAISPNSYGSTALDNTHASGKVTGGGSVGGLVGYVDGQGAVTINDSYADGAVFGDYWVGGLVGDIEQNNVNITNVYATGSVTGLGSVGGLIGYIDGGITISNGYATGAVSGNAEVGGLFGYDWNSTVSNLYWDMDSSGKSFARGSDASNLTGATGLTRDQAFTAASYQGFNNGHWVFIDGVRPLLASEWSNTITNAHQLQLMGQNTGAEYSLDRDLTMTSGGSSVFKDGFVSIASFGGYLDGQGHAISGLTITQAVGNTGPAGLFGQITANGMVYDLKLAGGSVTALGSGQVGSIAGANYGRIESVSSSMTVNGNIASGVTGGLVGYNGGQIQASAYKGAANGYVAGGIAGENAGAIRNSYASGSVTGGQKLGGIVGYNHGDGLTTGVIDTVLSTSTLTGEHKVGALVGSSGGGSLTNGRWSTTINGGIAAIGEGSVSVADNNLGYSTADLQDETKTEAVYAGFDLEETWALGSSAAVSGDGVAHFAELYRADNIVVVHADNEGTYGDEGFDNGYWAAGSLRDNEALNVNVDSSAYGSTTHAGKYQLGVQASVTGGASYRVVKLGTLTVAKRQVYVEMSGGGVTKTYDGTNTAVLTNGAFNIYDVRDGDSLTITGTGAYANSGVGSGITVSAGDLVLGGANAGDYEIVTDGPLVSNVGYINHALVTGTVTGNKTYDGSAALGANATTGLTGLVGDETLSATFTNVNFANKNAGAGKVLTGGLSIDLTGPVGSNYGVTSFDVVGTGTINAKTITAGLGGTVSKTYDGTTSATLGDNLSLGGLVDGDTVTVGSTGAVYADKNAGTGKTVTANGVTIGGADAGNYVLASTTASANVGTILQKALTITADSQVKNRNDADPLLTYVSAGLVSGDSLTGALTRDAGEAVGTYGILQGTLTGGGNYAVTYNRALLTINLGIPPVENLIIPYVPADGGGSTASGGSAGSGGAGGQRDGGNSVGFQLAVLGGGSGSDTSGQQQGGEDTTTCAAGEACQSAPYTQGGSTSGAIHFQGFMQ